jgi:hypothetical protein
MLSCFCLITQGARSVQNSLVVEGRLETTAHVGGVGGMSFLHGGCERGMYKMRAEYQVEINRGRSV